MKCDFVCQCAGKKNMAFSSICVHACVTLLCFRRSPHINLRSYAAQHRSAWTCMYWSYLSYWFGRIAIAQIPAKQSIKTILLSARACLSCHLLYYLCLVLLSSLSLPFAQSFCLFHGLLSDLFLSLLFLTGLICSVLNWSTVAWPN